MKTALKTAPGKNPLELKAVKEHLNITVGWTEDDNYLKTLILTATKKAEQYLRRKLITQTWYAYYDDWPRGEDDIILPFGQLQGGTVAAQGTITMSGIAVADETFIIDSQTFTWKAARGGAGEVTIGADASAAVTNIVAAITIDLATVTAVDGEVDTVVVTAATAGTIGNSIVFTESSANMTVNGSGTLGATTAGLDKTPVVKYTDTDGTQTTWSATEWNADTDADPGRIVLEYGYTWPTATLNPLNPIVIEFVCGYGDAGSDVEDMIRHAMKVMIDDLYNNRGDVLVGITSQNLKAVGDLLMPYRLHNVVTQ